MAHSDPGENNWLYTYIYNDDQKKSARRFQYGAASSFCLIAICLQQKTANGAPDYRAPGIPERRPLEIQRTFDAPITKYHDPLRQCSHILPFGRP